MIGTRNHAIAALAMLAALTPASGQSPVHVLDARVDSLFTRQIRIDTPGCAVGVYRNGEVVLARGYGLASLEDRRPITSRTTFDLGSASKPFTALAVLALEQRGKLSLDDDVRRWVPEIRNYGSPIHIRDLLQHSSGFRDYQALEQLRGRDATTMADFLGLMAAQRDLNFKPGTRHEYSHSDYLLLGLIVERVVGEPFGRYLEREVLRPMGMNGSFVDDERSHGPTDRAFAHLISSGEYQVRFPTARTVGGVNLYASVDDLAAWDRSFVDPKVGGPSVIAQMLSRPQLASGDTIPYAFGLRIGKYRGLRTVSRGGNSGGSRTEFVRFPDQGLTVATLCNADNLEARKLGQGVADIYLDSHMERASLATPASVAPAAVAMAPHEFSQYTGLYRPRDQQWNLIPIEVRNGVLGEVLHDEARDDTLFTMTPTGAGRFIEVGLTGNVGVFAFKPATMGFPRRLEITWSDGPNDALDRIADSAVWRPNLKALTEYGGTWFSHDVDASWQLEARGENLVLRRQGRRDLTLRPVKPDQFTRGFGSWMSSLYARLDFHRDRNGKITHFTVSTPPGEESVQGLRFVKLSSVK